MGFITNTCDARRDPIGRISGRHTGRADMARARIRTLFASETHGERFVTRTLGGALGL